MAANPVASLRTLGRGHSGHSHHWGGSSTRNGTAAPTTNGANAWHSCPRTSLPEDHIRGPRGSSRRSLQLLQLLQLVLGAEAVGTAVEELELMADAARLRAEREHGLRVAVAVSLSRPLKAALVLVLP